MLSVLLFTIMIIVAIVTRSVLIVLLCFLLVTVVSLVKKVKIQTLIVYLLSMLSGLGSVIVYDAFHRSQTLMGSGNNTFRVMEQQRINRYLVVMTNDEGGMNNGDEILRRTSSGGQGMETSSNGEKILLYSTASLSPGAIIQSNRNISLRQYDTSWCLLWCFEESRQDSQGMDSESFNYDAWLYMQGLDGSIYDNNPYVIGQEEIVPRMQLRTYIKDTLITRLGSDTVGALGLGMLIGDRSLFHNDDYQSFIDSGLVHLVAVSGGNIAIVVALASLLLFRVPFYIRIFLLIFVVVGYSYLVGTDSSVVRATVMALLTLFALLPGRQISIWRLLAYAWVLMLLRNPYYLVYDLGFVLSFGALIGIIRADKVVFHTLKMKISSGSMVTTSLSRRYNRQRRQEQGWTVLRILILPSVGAMIGVLPILIWNTGQINLFSPLWNMIIVPFVSLITTLLIVLIMLSWGWLSSMVGWMLSCIVSISSWGSEHGLVLSSVDRGAAAVVGIAMVCYRIWRIRQEVQDNSS